MTRFYLADGIQEKSSGFKGELKTKQEKGKRHQDKSSEFKVELEQIKTDQDRSRELKRIQEESSAFKRNQAKSREKSS